MESDKIADAVQSTAEASVKLAELAEKAGVFLAKIVGGPAEQIGEIFTDRIRLFKYKNLCAVADKVEAIHLKRRIQGKTIEIPPRFAIPLLEAAALENDEKLQQTWAMLVANGSDPNFKEGLHPSYVEVVKQLSPDEVTVLNSFQKTGSYPIIFSHHINPIYAVTAEQVRRNWIFAQEEISNLYETIYARYEDHCSQLPLKFKFNSRVYIDNLLRLRISELGYNFSEKDNHSNFYRYVGQIPTKEESKRTILIPARDEYFRMSTFGQNFMAACIADND